MSWELAQDKHQVLLERLIYGQFRLAAWVGQCEVNVLELDKRMRKDRLMGLEIEKEKKHQVFDVAQKREPAGRHKGRGGKVKIAG